MPLVHKLAVFAACLLPSTTALASEPAPATVFPGKVIEWPLPKPMFARSSAVAPDGSIYIAVPNDNKVLRFDPKTQTFRDWDLPNSHQPSSVIVDRKGMVWTAGNGNGTIGKLKPSNSAIAEYAVPSGNASGPHTLAISNDGETLWFTMQTGNRIGSVDTLTGRIAEYETTGNPSGITMDRAGNVWWCRSSDDKLGRLEPRTGKISELDMTRGSRPRRIATAPDGMLWATLSGNGRLAKIDPVNNKVVDIYPLPGGNAGAYSVTVDDAGIVWANQIKLDTVIRFDPSSISMQIIKLPSTNTGIRQLTADGNRLWYTGSHNGRLGVIE